MTWLENLQKSISYIESHLLDENLTADTVARGEKVLDAALKYSRLLSGETPPK